MIRLRSFDSGVLVVQSLAHNENNVIEETSKLVITVIFWLIN